MARVALAAALAEIDAAAFIISESGTVLHANAAGEQKVARSRDRLRSVLQRAVRSVGDPKLTVPALVTPLRCDATTTYFLVIFRPRATRASNVEYAATLWQLSPRQREVLELLVEGLANKTIAVRLDCAERTVETHLTAIFQKSGFDSRSALLGALARNEL
jgi:DNA-binding NarL/FixJ family response regulator